MYTKITILSLLTSIVLLFSGCKDDDQERGIVPVEQVSQAFAEKYPNARNIVFEIEGKYYVADFTNEGYPTTAWFTDQGKWMMEKIEYPFSRLPQKVTTAFFEGIYGDWEIEECYEINRAGMGTVYKIEIQKGERERELYYSSLGNLIKTVEDDKNEDQPMIVPQEVTDLLNLTFAGSELLDMQTRSTGTELDIIDDGVYKVVQLNSNYRWLSTTWKLSKEEVPEVVREGFEASEYAGNPVEEMQIWVDADGVFYLFTVKRHSQTIVVTLDPFGQVIKAELKEK